MLTKSNIKKITLILVGSITWIFTMIKSGWQYSYGLGFWGANGHDGIWHIALANSLSHGSLSMPTFAGSRLQNYHIGFDLLLVLLSKLTTIPIANLYFQIAPILLAILIGITAYIFVFIWTKSTKASLWSMFFIYFGGSFGWIVNLVRNGNFSGESMFWSQQSISTLINPPFALSLIFLFIGLTFLSKEKKNVWTYLLMVVFFGCLIQIKSYAGLLALGGLFVTGVYKFLTNKKLDLLLVFVSSLIISILLFIPLNKLSTGLLVFKPFWFLETMMGLTDRLGWLKFYSAMMNYRAGGIWLKMIPAYFVAFIIFVIGNLGTRVVGIIEIVKRVKKLTTIDIFLQSIIAAGIIIPTLFLQKGTPWNTIQFFYYSLMFMGIYAGITISKANTKKVMIAVAIIVLLTIPTTIATLAYDYLPSRPPAKISTQELKALEFLSKQEYGVVLTYPFDEAKAKEALNNPPRPLYFYDSIAYVSAYSGKQVYLEDQVNLDITGYNWIVRRDKEDWFIRTTDQKLAKEFLKENNIKYIYLVKPLSPLPGEYLKLGTKQLNTENIFENNEVVMFKVD